jgi:hypothetical protein
MGSGLGRRRGEGEVVVVVLVVVVGVVVALVVAASRNRFLYCVLCDDVHEPDPDGVIMVGAVMMPDDDGVPKSLLIVFELV